MADVFDRKKRSQIMASIRGFGTSIERSLSRLLRELGIKPRCHQKHLPGSPDFVLYRQKVIIFTNGCFWHGHQKCKRAVLPTTNRAFWERKVSKNIRRDRKQRRLLRKMGWRVITFWSCKKITVQNLAARLRRVGVKISA
jgi:DNA mismatch endonuclease, patch repair protein